MANILICFTIEVEGCIASSNSEVSRHVQLPGIRTIDTVAEVITCKSFAFANRELGVKFAGRAFYMET